MFWIECYTVAGLVVSSAAQLIKPKSYTMSGGDEYASLAMMLTIFLVWPLFLILWMADPFVD